MNNPKGASARHSSYNFESNQSTNNNNNINNNEYSTTPTPTVVVTRESSSSNMSSSSGRQSPNNKRRDNNITEIPQELHDILLNFTVHYLIQRPGDVVDYALEYFSRLNRSRQSDEIQGHSEDESMISDEEIADAPVLTYRDTGRRKSVFAEAYNPEEDDTEEKTVVYPKSDQQRQSLLEAVRGSLLFRSLDQEQLGQVLDAMFERSVASGENIIRQGDDGDNFYIIESGIYDIYVKTGDSSGDKAIGNYDNTGSFGELALMYNMPRAATIKAVTDGLLWAMDRSTFRKIVLRNAFQKRQMYEKLLESVPLLSTLSPYERMNLADALVSRSFDSGEIIVKQGNVADGMYFIEDGRVSISMMNNDQEKFIKNQEKGEYFGELALVTHKPRAATVKAEGNVRLAFLDVKAFERLLGPCLELMEKNIPDYEEQIVRIFGSKAAISDVR
ncbi:cAMP-dependent protein kinase type II regulatory subunit isoform X1 [Lepeophtheirus salmonis]|uniref:cAMP-dependent protein kinase type II regulatory subunit n=1 Tax=Lepeophtheirus salmonis TaxID=72036 RepID=A0A0K2TXU9_LEPSM|nr:cAMP-dependent protein kinase type II regulatory subunit-like isoform X1 [Lepeophtheirus salmonis]